jgi:crossover junction endodeoxyribonuclease RuvC
MAFERACLFAPSLVEPLKWLALGGTCIMRILGIDPGLQLTGYGCVDLRPRSHEPALIEAGVLRLKPKASLAFRLAQLKDDLDALLEELKPEVLVVEKLFSHYRHARTAIIMGHARGVVLLAGQARGLRIEELAPTEIKRAVTGNGHASKNHVQRAVMKQCGLRQLPEPPDVADAIAIALCAARRLA